MADFHWSVGIYSLSMLKFCVARNKIIISVQYVEVHTSITLLGKFSPFSLQSNASRLSNLRGFYLFKIFYPLDAWIRSFGHCYGRVQTKERNDLLAWSDPEYSSDPDRGPDPSFWVTYYAMSFNWSKLSFDFPAVWLWILVNRKFFIWPRLARDPE